MIVLNINDNYQSIIKKTAEVIGRGGLVLFPSDTVYILAVDPTNQTAVDKLLAFKNRWTGKAISIAVLDKKMAMNYVTLSANGENIYANLLPGPFTVVSKGKHKVAKGIEAENGTLGIRIPDNLYIHELIRTLDKPITATSANLSGRTPNYSVTSFLKPLSKKKLAMIDLIVDDGKLPKNKPSTVIDTTTPSIEILRRGDLMVGSTQKLISKSEKETEKIAEFLLKKSLLHLPLTREGKALVFGLTGDLGCGKTVFSRAIGKTLGIKEKITSPTFVIYNEYKSPSPVSTIVSPGLSPLKKGEQIISRFLHFDLYRLGEKFEFEEIKFLDQFTAGTLACIEWPENMGSEYFWKLKKIVNYVPINFKYLDTKTREISFDL